MRAVTREYRGVVPTARERIEKERREEKKSMKGWGEGGKERRKRGKGRKRSVRGHSQQLPFTHACYYF